MAVAHNKAENSSDNLPSHPTVTIA